MFFFFTEDPDKRKLNINEALLQYRYCKNMAILPTRQHNKFWICPRACLDWYGEGGHAGGEERPVRREEAAGAEAQEHRDRAHHGQEPQGSGGAQVRFVLRKGVRTDGKNY